MTCTRAVSRASWCNRFTAILGLGLVASNCGGDEQNRGGLGSPGSIDSSGVDVVYTGVTTATPIWTVAPEVEISIGETDGDGPYMLFDVRFAARLSDGGIVIVSNNPDAVVRFYDANGSFLHSVGRKGGGPGEFSEPIHAQLFPSDSLVVYDLGRVTWIAPDGTSDQVSMSGMQEKLGAGGLALSSRRFVLMGGRGDGVFGEDERRSLRHVIITDWALSRVDTVTSHPWPAPDLDPVPGTRGLPEISPQLGVWALQDRVVVSSSDRYEIEIYDSSGNLIQLLRRNDVSPEQVTSERVVEFAESGFPMFGWTPDSLYDLLRDSSLPTHGNMTMDIEGNLWVSTPNLPWNPYRLREFTVYDPDGRIIAIARIPPRNEMRVDFIDATHVTGVMRDELGVERVVVRRLLKQ